MAEKYDEDDVPTREITAPKKGAGGLFIEPDDYSAAREVIEQHNRDRFAGHYKFADPFTGLTRTFDEVGDYNCGRCNQADGNKCLLVSVARIDWRAGSCGDWENTCAGDPEMRGLRKKTPQVAGYGVAENGIGFGCHRCPFASRAKHPDSRMRTLYCGLGDFRTFWNACCVLNGAPTVKQPSRVGLPPNH